MTIAGPVADPTEVPASGDGGPNVGPRRRRLARLVGGLALAVAVLIAGPVMTLPPPTGPVVPGLTVGATHTQHSVEPWNPSSAVHRATKVLAAVAPLQNQALMGWGAADPEPRPGVYNWHTLDQRIDTITGTGAEPVLTLCCAPDWMKGGKPGQTDWSRIEVAPTAAHYSDFARLAQQAARRYPQVHRFLVWNELKGFWDAQRNTWDVAAYTKMYNKVYRAVKKVRPDAQVGGPYTPFDSWSSSSVGGHPSKISGPWGVLDQRSLDAVDYWLKHAVGADFVAVDGGTATRDRGLVTTDFAATAKLAAVTRWVRSRTELPIWWAEIYAPTNQSQAPAGDPRRAAVMATALAAVARAGASVALLWQPRAAPDLNSAALFSSTAGAGGGRPLPLASLLQDMERQLRTDPRRVLVHWNAAASEWTLEVPGWKRTWSSAGGLGPPQFSTALRKPLV